MECLLRFASLSNSKVKISIYSFLQLTNFGASIVSIKLPTKDNQIVDIVLGFDDLQSYIRYNKRDA